VKVYLNANPDCSRDGRLGLPTDSIRGNLAVSVSADTDTIC
jgi:hypothetical protein